MHHKQVWLRQAAGWCPGQVLHGKSKIAPIWLRRVHPLTRLRDVVGDCARAHTIQCSPRAMHPSVYFPSLRAQWRAAGRISLESESDDSPVSPAGLVRCRLCQRSPAHQRCDHVYTLIYSDTCVYIQIQDTCALHTNIQA